MFFLDNRQVEVGRWSNVKGGFDASSRQCEVELLVRITESIAIVDSLSGVASVFSCMYAHGNAGIKTSGCWVEGWVQRYYRTFGNKNSIRLFSYLRPGILKKIKLITMQNPLRLSKYFK